ncbi:MAG TPA: linear amide C-N hydrolase [Tissierellaceae bacterium]
MCTGIKIDYDDGCVMGRTMDYEVPLRYNVLYLPRNYHYSNDLMGNPMYSKYKAMGLCFENRNPLKDGVNEHGLVGITNEFNGFNLYDCTVNPGKVNISSLDYFTYALTNYKNVDELVEDLPNIHISTRNGMGQSVICPDFHFMFADSTKRCIVVEPKEKKLVYYENPYDVMTNSPSFEAQVRRLRKFLDINNLEDFNSAKDLPGGYDPVSRFIKAYYLTKMNVKSRDYKEAISHAYNILSAMALPNGFIRNKKYNHNTYTRYICVYDTKNKLLTVRSDTNPTIYSLSFEDIKEEDKRKAFFLNLDLNMEKLV